MFVYVMMLCYDDMIYMFVLHPGTKRLDQVYRNNARKCRNKISVEIVRSQNRLNRFKI